MDVFRAPGSMGCANSELNLLQCNLPVTRPAQLMILVEGHVDSDVHGVVLLLDELVHDGRLEGHNGRLSGCD